MKPDFVPRPLFRRGEVLGELIIRPFNSFASLEASGGIVILLAAVVALVWANSSLSESYEHFWHAHLLVGKNGFVLDKPLHFWVNDGLMAIFFFVVGLEIKREILVGELSTFRQAALPMSAAIGGMLVPALIYFALNPEGPSAKGWAIPMATDIAFTIGAAKLLGARVPRSLLIFLTALAIVDDLGAVLVIAIFYTSDIAVNHLLVTGVSLLVLAGINILGFRRPFPYIVLGCLVWLTVFLSGLHATVAGILVAMTIPARSRFDTDTFLRRAQRILDEFDCAGTCSYSVYTNEDHQAAVRTLESMCRSVEPPLHRIEYFLHPWVVFGIMPLFALANAGVAMNLGDIGATLTSPTSLGIILGLVVGKQIGITAGAWIAVKSRLALLPEGIGFKHIYGGSALCGIGFTMSLFIANLAFAGEPILDPAKIGILAASLISGVVGLLVLHLGTRKGDGK